MSVRHDRLLAAERAGLRLALTVRGAFLLVALIWFLSWSWNSEAGPSPAGLATLIALFIIGAVQFALIGGRYDQPWLKFLIYGMDMAVICAAFALVPLSGAGEVPQHLVFRAYGVHLLVAPIAMATLSLSWGLVIWTGVVGAVGWWSAFYATISDVAEPLSWADMPVNPPADMYIELVLDPNFIGHGNRVVETVMLLVIAATLALAVARARRVFLAQVSAEDAREAAAATLGRYVPDGVAEELIADGAALKPQMRDGVAMVMDVRDFTKFAAARDPEAVIRALNDFLAEAETAVRKHGGAVISFTGDGLLAAFNALQPIDDPEVSAISAARDLLDVGAGAGFEIRVGLASGQLAAGSVGSADRRAFTVYGDTVNRAARLEALAKTLGEQVLGDEGISAFADDARDLGEQTLRGIGTKARVYALSSKSA